MPLQSYAVLKCRVLEGQEGQNGSPHYQIHGADPNNTHYRIAVNIHSQAEPSELLYYCDEHFEHPIIQKMSALDDGLTLLNSTSNSAALDYIRGNLFDRRQMKILPAELPGADNDLNEQIGKYIRWALTMNDALIYAFGAAWGPEEQADSYFDFTPGRGIHDVHMNQGNSGKWATDNGPWQDGGLFFHFPSIDRWVAIFLAFQSQSFVTVAETGEPVGNNVPAPQRDTIRILTALVHPSNKGRETVTLINTTNHKIDITDWVLTDNLNFKRVLYGEIRPGEFLTIPLMSKNAGSHGHEFAKEGGIISLLEPNGLKIHGVSYTEKDYQQEDCTLTF
ncbi:MAG TPA: DUF2278 domain-containing protein [Firmicutes bacterium]|nr:DUF2278 domain-containing protein [Bacillota bacterium]